MEKASSLIGDDKPAALMAYWMAQQWPNQELWHNEVCCWVKLQLLNGQMAQSVWYESSVSTKICCTSCIKVCHLNLLFITGYLNSYIDKVPWYLSYCKCTILFLYAIWRPAVSTDNGPPILYARKRCVVRLKPNFVLCDPLDLQEGLAVIPVTGTHLVIAMLLDMAMSQGGNITLTRKYMLMRHAYIELAPFTSGGLFEDDGENSVVHKQ